MVNCVGEGQAVARVHHPNPSGVSPYRIHQHVRKDTEEPRLPRAVFERSSAQSLSLDPARASLVELHEILS